MISVEDFEEFWLDNPALEKALLDVIDVTRKPSSKTVDGTQIDIGWFKFGGVRSVGVDITHPQFSLTFETVFDPARVAGEKYRVALTDDERYDMLMSFGGHNGTSAYQKFFNWLATSASRPSDLLKIQVAAVCFTQIPHIAA